MCTHAERATFGSYVLFAVFYSAWVYPVVAHWHWSPNGWLSAHKEDPLMGVGTIDFAGSSEWSYLSVGACRGHEGWVVRSGAICA